MKEKLMERFNWKLSKFCETNDSTSVLYDRYGELTGILDTMIECNMLTIKDYTSLLRTVDYIYNEQMGRKIK